MIEQNTKPPADFQPAKNWLEGRVILVTGVGSKNLAHAAALGYAAQGATVILHGKNVQKLEAVYDEIEALGYPQPAIIPLDYLTATDALLDGFAQTIRTTFGRLDGIFHGASHFSPLMPLASQGLDVWQKHLNINLAVPAALTKACLPLLKQAPDAAVIFLSETHAAKPTAYWGAFATAKSGLHALAEIWAAEMTSEEKVRFHVCVPGPVASPMRNKSHPAELAAALPNPTSFERHFLYLMRPVASG